MVCQQYGGNNNLKQQGNRIIKLEMRSVKQENGFINELEIHPLYGGLLSSCCGGL